MACGEAPPPPGPNIPGSLTVLPVLPLSRVFPPSVPSSASFSFEVQNLWFSPVGGECFGTLAQEGRGRNLGPC